MNNLLKSIKRKFVVVEDGGGNLYLYIFSAKGDFVEYGFENFENDPFTLKDAICELAEDEDAIERWDGKIEEPDKHFNDLTSAEFGWERVADNNGLYVNKMTGVVRDVF